MDDSSLAKLFTWANSIYLIGVATAAIGSFGLYFFGARMTALKDAELKRFQIESARTIAEANARAAEANKGAARAEEGTAKALAEAAAANERTQRFELAAQEQRERAAEAEREAVRDLLTNWNVSLPP
jgi:hypothetical protein